MRILAQLGKLKITTYYAYSGMFEYDMKQCKAISFGTFWKCNSHLNFNHLHTNVWGMCYFDVISVMNVENYSKHDHLLPWPHKHSFLEHTLGLSFNHVLYLYKVWTNEIEMKKVLQIPQIRTIARKESYMQWFYMWRHMLATCIK